MTTALHDNWLLQSAGKLPVLLVIGTPASGTEVPWQETEASLVATLVRRLA